MPTAYLNIIDYALAKNEVTNAQLAEEFPQFTEEKIQKTFGIKSRFKVDSGTICTDFAAKYVNPLLDKHHIHRDEIDFLIYCTEAPDYIAPASSVILHKKLGLPSSCGTFDLNFGCSGYTYGLLMAKSLIESGMATKVLFVTADLPSTGISKDHVELHALFSDAVSISVLSSNSKGMKINHFISGTDGNGEKALRVAHSGYNNPKGKMWFANEQTKNLPVGKMEMNGMQVFRFSLEIVPRLINQVLEKNNLRFEEIDLFVFHQASGIILKSLQRKLKIADSKIFNNIVEVGNTVSASIPIALKQAMEQEKIRKNKNILIAGFGIGFSWSATILNTNDL